MKVAGVQASYSMQPAECSWNSPWNCSARLAVHSLLLVDAMQVKQKKRKKIA